MTRKTPEEKKRLSLLKDRRNLRPESKQGRRRLARRKRELNREDRRKPATKLRGLAGQRDPALEESVDGDPGRKRHHWSKIPSTPLIAVVEQKLARRVKAGIISVETADEATTKLRRHAKKAR